MKIGHQQRAPSYTSLNNISPLYRRSGGRRRRHNALGRGGVRHIAESTVAVAEWQRQSLVRKEEMSSDKALEHRDALYLAKLCQEMESQNSTSRCALLIEAERTMCLT